MTDCAVAALMYHDVVEDVPPPQFRRVAVPRGDVAPELFLRHLRCLAAAGLRPELITGFDPAAPGGHLLLTFDDGGRSALFIGEALARRGWAGHFFIITGQLGDRGFLRPDDLRTLRREGHLIGSHTHTHPDAFGEQTRLRMYEEWRRSGDILADLLGEPCLAASVPGGRVSRVVAETAEAAGYRYLFTAEPGMLPLRSCGCWLIGRSGIGAGTSPGGVLSLARFHGWRLRRAVPDLHPPAEQPGALADGETPAVPLAGDPSRR